MVSAPLPAPHPVRFGSFELDLRSGELRKDGSRVNLQDQPFQVLVVLLERPGELVTRDELRQRLWRSDTYVDFEHGLNAAVKRLRDALGDSAETPRFVETVPRRGYRLIAPVDAAVAETRSARRPLGRRRAWLALPAAAALLAAAWAVLPSMREPNRSEARTPVRFTIDVEQTGVTSGGMAGGEGGLVAVCPDGSCVVYRGAQQGVGRLYLHSFDRLRSTALPGTEGGHGPFFSPDGRSLGFFAERRLKKISLDTLVVEVVCDAPDSRGAAWSPDGSIFFTPRRSAPIWRVSGAGGTPEAVTRLEAAAGEISHRWPVLVPGQKLLLYQSIDESERSRIVAQDLGTAERRTIVEGGEFPRLTSDGRLVFGVKDTLRAVHFDARSAGVDGTPTELLDKVSGAPIAAGKFDVSSHGVLAYMYLVRRTTDGQLWRVERSGRAAPLSDLRRPFQWPRFSPDGQRLAVTVSDGARSNVWIYDLARRTLSRLTLDGSDSEAAVWSPDGRRLLYRSNRTGIFNLFVEPADGSGPVDRVVASSKELFPGSWAPDGRTLLFQEYGYATGADIWVQPLTGSRTRRPFVHSEHGEWDGIFSPDGRLVAYTSMESGRLEVFLRSYPAGGKCQVSNEGGNSPVWARSGRELFYLNGDRMMSARIGTGSGCRVDRPESLFEGEYAYAGQLANYDVAPDGRAFVMVRGAQRQSWMQLNVVLNWSQELKRRATGQPGG